MNTGITSARYAKALLTYATELKQEEAVYQEMAQLLQSFKAQPRLAALLQNPALPNKQKTELLIAAATTSNGVSTATKRFMSVLVDNKRADVAQYIAVSFQNQYRQEKKLIEARLTTAITPSPTITERMRTMVEKRTGCKVSFDTVVDAEIGAGFVLEYDTYRMDASLRRQLSDLKRALAS
ncbi:MAG: F0F1 ATP synthase subunit delta [Bacteroidaceae bacterium]|nr:F0F1 ATP synthase subunit delta [Bacteroidaceae bacterium]